MRSGQESTAPYEDDLAAWTMDELLAACPQAAEVLAKHGVDPRSRCNHAVRHYLGLGRVLGRNCPVDDPAAVLAELRSMLALQRY